MRLHHTGMELSVHFIIVIVKHRNVDIMQEISTRASPATNQIGAIEYANHPYRVGGIQING